MMFAPLMLAIRAVYLDLNYTDIVTPIFNLASGLIVPVELIGELIVLFLAVEHWMEHKAFQAVAVRLGAGTAIVIALNPLGHAVLTLIKGG
jgi:hypothetical protein